MVTPSARAAAVQLCLSDCDGVLTDAGVYYGPSGEELKRFSLRDGMGVQLLREAGVEVGIVSGERSPALRARAGKLRISELHMGISDKRSAMVAICARLRLRPHEVAFIGDDVNDLDVMSAVGLAVAPCDAVAAAREIAHVVTEARGGHGAFRELADLIVSAKRREETA